MSGTNGRFHFAPLTGLGTEHSLTTGRFLEAKFHWPLFGNESWKATVESVPFAAVRRKWKRTIPTCSKKKKAAFRYETEIVLLEDCFAAVKIVGATNCTLAK